MTRYAPSRSYTVASLLSLVFSVASVWTATLWLPTILLAAFFLVISAASALLALQPAVELRRDSIRCGSFRASWRQVRRVEYKMRAFLLVIHLTMANGRQRRILHPGSRVSGGRLMRDLRTLSTSFLERQEKLPRESDEFPEVNAGPSLREAMQRVRILSPDDEADVKMLFQRLKAVGHLDSSGQNEEN
jgi:hypothetical protein